MSIHQSTKNYEEENFFEWIQMYNMGDKLTYYEEKLYRTIQRLHYSDLKEVLTNFCLDLFELPEKERQFTLRIFFVGFVTNIIHLQNKEGRLDSHVILRAYRMIEEIERWTNVSEYIFHIDSFVLYLKRYILFDHLLYTGNSHLKQAFNLIYKHLRTDYLNVNWVAKQLEISSTHLTNLFRTHVKKTASQYIAHMKIKQIILSMIHSNDSLKKIRKQYGFKNHSHFIQFFKRHTNMTPLQYLQKHIP